MLQLNAAPGIHRLEDAFVNWYLVEADDGLTAVDAGLPASWDSLLRAVRQIGRTLGDLRAVVLTHAHFDHVGFAERARRELGVPVLVHPADVSLTRHPLLYRWERPPAMYLVNPAGRRLAASFLRSGALWAPRIGEVRTFSPGDTLDVPGAPVVVATPGHTHGHCALHFAERDVLIAGDAVVTLDPYTGARGPKLVSRAATADSRLALQSLDRIAATGAKIVLTGHGPVWRDGAEAAAERARSAGLS